MAHGVVDDPVLARLREEVEKAGSCSAAASKLGLERTLVWRAFAGHGIRRASCRRIGEALDRQLALEPGPLRSEIEFQQIDVANLRSVLQYILSAVDTLEEVRRG